MTMFHRSLDSPILSLPQGLKLEQSGFTVCGCYLLAVLSSGVIILFSSGGVVRCDMRFLLFIVIIQQQHFLKEFPF